MNFTPLPKTSRERELTWVRSCLVAGGVLLLVQVSTRIALSGGTRQFIEETLWPWPFFFSILLLYWSVVALFFRRERVLGVIGITVSILSALVALLPILLREPIYD